MTKKKGRPRAQVPVKVGDHVLIGTNVASYPGQWICGAVLWAGPTELLIERSNGHGDRWCQLQYRSQVLAAGTIEELVRVSLEAQNAVREQRRVIFDAEAALGRARDALWAKLEEMHEKGLEIAIPDFDRIEADHDADRRALERADEEAAEREDADEIGMN